MKYFNFTNYNGHTRGFTLVELLVSLALFTTVITIATGSLFSAQAINVRLEQSQVILDGVNLAVEVMARDMWYGSSFYCDVSIPGSLLISRKSCPYSTSSGGSVLIFKPVVGFPSTTNASLDRTAYYLSNGIIYKDEYVEGNVNNKKTYQITSSDVLIKALTFFVIGAESSQASTPDLNQPIITMIVSGTTLSYNAEINSVPFSVQTSVSARGLDN
ncbi:MAG: prepilin-type N-terminal cleavage/methylation domain-containing protein [Candidatus Paceibacterota bacterium]|jgi:prepilin-type N-terminal cleavage/methylation domain-containing protein